MTDRCRTIIVDGVPVSVRGDKPMDTESQDAFEEVVRAAWRHAASQPAVPCHSPRCDYNEPHRHGFGCGPRCLCGQGMQARVSEVVSS